jgi:hypothetical protein
MPWDALDWKAVLILRKALGTQGDALVNANVLSNDAGLSDDDSGAVVDEEAFADLCSGVHVDSCLCVRMLGDHAREERHLELMELVGEALAGDGDDTGVTKDGLVGRGCRGVSIEGGLHVGRKDCSHCGQPLKEFAHYVSGARLGRRTLLRRVTRDEDEAVLDLARSRR